MTDTALLDRDEVIAEALASGRSTRAITKELRVTTAELDAALERLFPIDTQARVRMIKSDLAQINRLTEIFFLKAVAGDVQAGTLTVKIWERKHELLGLDAVQQIDLQIINPPQEVPRHEKIREAIMRLTEQPPVRRAAIDRIDQLGPEKALEMLGPPHPKQLNGGGGSPPDPGSEPSIGG